MAQMAPALAEAAGSPSPNGSISSSSVQNALREPYIEKGNTIDNSKLHINSNHNGFCRSMANSNIKSTGKRGLDDKLNNLSRALHNSSDSSKSSKLDSQGTSLPPSGDDVVTREQIRPISSQKEGLFRTPTRIPITTTKTCGSNSLQNRSSCQASDNKTNDETQQRHLFPCPEPSPRLLFEKKVKKIGLNQACLSTRARKLERRLRTLQSRQLETHVTEQLQTFAVNRRKTQQSSSQQKFEQVKQDLTLRQASSQFKEEASKESTSKPVARVGEELPSNASSGQNNINKHDELRENNVKTDSGGVVNNSEKETKGRARSLVCQLELAEHVGDSDATDCSSGAESCDEMDFSPTHSESKAKR